MWNLYFFNIISFVHVVFTYNYMSNDGVTISYSTSRSSRNVCHSQAGRFAVIQGVSLPECVKECGLRKHCQALQYRRRFYICELFQSMADGDVQAGDCFFINRVDIYVHTIPCSNCTYGSFCDTTLAICRHQECFSAAAPDNGKIQGNSNDVNGKIKFTCDDGYSERNDLTEAVCLENGNWSTTAECLTAETDITCGFLPSVLRGSVVLDTVNGYFYMDTATVICDDWFQTETPSITCTSAGSWENAADCIDCYPTTPWEYIGKTNVTKLGKQCQRWDSQQPHSHPHTDKQYFPETNLFDANNYCRNPERGEYDPWCMTMDLDKEWEFCNVPKCPWT